ncbi:hypothetical protein D9M71_166180 [compost metagenome]
MADASVGVDEVVRRPVLVVEGAPDRVVVVDGDRIVDAELAHRLGHIAYIALEGEFRRVHADHHQPLVAVFVRPGFHVGQGAQAVDAGVGPEIHQHHLAAQALCAQRWRVKPLDGAAQRGQRAFVRQRGFLHAHGIVGGHHHARRLALHGRRRSGALARSGQAVHQLLFQSAGGGEGQSSQHAGIHAEGDGGDAGQHGGAEAALDPLADAKGLLHRGEHLAAEQHGEAQRSSGTGRIGEQQQGRIEACALQRGAGQDQAEDRPRARSPQQAGGDAEHERCAGTPLSIALRRCRQAIAGGDQRAGQPLGDARQHQRQAEDRDQRQGQPAPILVGGDHPATADGGE